MKSLLIAGAAMALISIPAQAQLLGGSGGGALGGTLGGTGAIGLPSLPSAPDLPNPTSDLPSARGTLDGAASGHGSARADRKSGKVHANGGGSANGAGTLTGPLLDASGNGSASGEGSASAQLVGTDTVRSAAQSARAAGTQTAQQARGTAAGAVGTARSAAGSAAALAGSASGSAQGAAGGAASAAYSSLAVAGSAAASGSGAFAVDKGMPVLAPDGSKIGKVRQVVADSQGRVQQLLVKVDGKKALIPAGNFSGSGNAVVSAMGEGSIKSLADQQDETGANAG